MTKEKLPTAKEADIAFCLEGSYPYISGGVSSWVHHIIQSFPDIRFALIFIGSKPSDYEGLKYKLPDNVVHMETHYLFEEDFNKKPIPFFSWLKNYKNVKLLHEFFQAPERQQIEEEFADLDFFINFNGKVDYRDFYKSRKAWYQITDHYLNYCSDPSFLEYYWAILSLQRPVWMVAEVVKKCIKVKAVHSASTGYAGFLGALLHHKYNYPLLLTEHGIYTRERRIELWQREIAVGKGMLTHMISEESYIETLWARFFELLSHICYNASGSIISLYSGAQKIQIAEGAEVSKTQVIPNGISVKAFNEVLARRDKKIPKILCLMGRVVPIKDIKNFIRAVGLVLKQIPDAEGWVVGSENEDPEYVQECHNLIKVLGLENKVLLKGWQNSRDIYSQAGLIVLSSVSEGMPLVLLESFASGVPCIATDVGACRGLIEGETEEDRSLGFSGRVVPIGNPNALAEMAIELLNDEKEWHLAQEAGLKRVETYYDEGLMKDRYRVLYDDLLGK